MNDNNIRFEDLTGQSGGTGSTPPTAPQKNSYSISSLVLGIISIVFACCINEYISIACGVIAIVFYVLAKRNAVANGMSTAGLVCGIIGIILSVVSIISAIVMGIVIATNPELSSLLDSFINMGL